MRSSSKSYLNLTVAPRGDSTMTLRDRSSRKALRFIERDIAHPSCREGWVASAKPLHPPVEARAMSGIERSTTRTVNSGQLSSRLMRSGGVVTQTLHQRIE